MPALRIVFFGTAELACPILAALVQQADFEVAAVVTQPDRPKGRDLKLQPPPVKREAILRQLPVLQPERARHALFLAELREYKPELIVVAAYGQILPPALLELPPFGCVNVHTSLLPKYRGAAPIQWAILNGELETGVTIMKMDAGLDTGDILTQERTAISSSDTGQTLHDRLASIGARLLIRTIPEYIAGNLSPRPQPQDGASYARKITKEDGKLDWAQPARVLWNRVRALVPWPGAFTYLSQPTKPLLLKVWQAELLEGVEAEPGRIVQADRTGLVVACGKGALRIGSLQREGGRRLSAAEFLAGHALSVGQQLAS